MIAGGIKGNVLACMRCKHVSCLSAPHFCCSTYITMCCTWVSLKPTWHLGNLSSHVPDKFRELGHQGWTMMPVGGLPQWYTLVTSLILGVGIGCLAQPQLVVRFMTVKSGREIKRGVFIGWFVYRSHCCSVYHASGIEQPLFHEDAWSRGNRRWCQI